MELKDLLIEIKYLRQQVKAGYEPSFYHLKGVRQVIKCIYEYQNNITMSRSIEENEDFKKILEELQIE